MASLNRERLVQLLGMFGSSAVGERANAASLADSMVRRAGLTWMEVLAGNSNKTEQAADNDVAQVLNREIEGYRRDVSRLEKGLEAARLDVRSLTEQLERERESIEHERAAWSKERETLRQMSNASFLGDEWGLCPDCKKLRHSSATTCIHCGSTEAVKIANRDPPLAKLAQEGTRRHAIKRWGAGALALVGILAGTVILVHLQNQQSDITQERPTTVPRLVQTPRIELDMRTSSVELADGHYIVRGELVNAGTAPGSTTALRLVFRKGDAVLGERTYPLAEGPIAPGQRLSFTRPFDDPPDGTTNVVPSVE
jgi:hypothetical protein